MTPHAVLVALAIAMPGPWGSSEPEASRAERVETIVEAAVTEATAGADRWPGTPDELAALALATTYEESQRWALDVHEGRRTGDHGQSRCLGMIWTRERGLVGTSSEATHRCLRRTVEVLVFHARRCRVRRIDVRQVARIVSGYGSGWSCSSSWAWSRGRTALWVALMAELRTRAA